MALCLGLLAACSSKNAGNSGVGGGGGADAAGRSAGPGGAGTGGAGTGGVTGVGGVTGAGGAPSTGTGGGTAGGTAGQTGSGGAVTGTGGAGGAAPLPGVACAGASPWTTTGTPATRLVVDAGQRGKAWSRFYEKVVASDHANTILTTAYGRNIQAALKKGHDQAGFGYVRFHGILDDDVGVYSEVGGQPVYNWTKLDQIYDAIIAAGMRPFVEISFMPKALASDATKIQTLLWYNGQSPNISPPRDVTIWKTFMSTLVQHLESRYGAAEVRNNWYFEVWNESSWMYSVMNGYNPLYQMTAQGLLAGDPLIHVGGPAESQGGSTFLVDSLIKFSKTAANNARLDFVSYHAYGQSNPTTLAIASPSGTTDTTATVDFHAAIMNIVRNDTFTGDVFVTEWGPTYSLSNVQSDNEVAASYIAKVVHLLGSGTLPPPAGFSYWTISDLYEENDTGGNTAFRGGNFGLLLKGDSQIPASFDVSKPAFNAFRLLHLMGDVQLSTTGGTTGNGVNASATISGNNSALQILVYNHTDGGVADSSASRLVNLTVNNLPFAAGPLHIRQYVVDRNHANAYTTWVGQGSPAKPTAQQWATLAAAADLCYYDTTVTPTGSSWSASFPQNNYSVSLLVISR